MEDGQQTEHPDGDKKADEDLGKRLDDTLKRLEALETENKALRRDQMSLLTAQPAAPQASAAAPQAPTLDTSGLPDPSVDPEGYSREFAQRNQTYVDALLRYQEAQKASTASQEGRASGLVAQFQERYPNIDIDLAQVAAQKVLNRMSARGLDTERFMYGATEMFFEAVAEEHEKMVSGLKGETKTPTTPGNDATTPANTTPSSTPEADLIRTGGIPGGSEAGSVPAGTPKTPQPDSIGDLLEAAQKKTGLFW